MSFGPTREGGGGGGSKTAYSEYGPQSGFPVLKAGILNSNDSSKWRFCGDGRAVIQSHSLPDTEQVLQVTIFQDSEGVRFHDCRLYNV
jgi:hypothetical protein